MSTANRMWSKEGVSVDGGKTINVEGWHIVDAADKATALATSGLPQYNDPQSSGSPYRVRRINISNYNGPTQWLATIEYAIPDNGEFPNPEPDPLLRPFRWRVDPSYEERANEMDAKRRLKKNSAGIIFPPRPSRYRRRMIVGTRYEPFWNLNKARKFENKTNLNPITLGPVTILPYEALCHAIEPASEFEGDADYLLMQYVIEVAVDERATPQTNTNDPPISGYPFEQHQLDISNFGWYSNGGSKQRGRFCYASGTTASSSGNYVIADADDVQLDGQGKPVTRSGERTIYVRSDDGKLIYDATTNPNTAEWLTGGTYPSGTNPTESPYSSTANRMWLFLDHVAIDWSTLFTI